MGYTHNEIPLFRAFQDSLLALSNKFQIEEYHGNSHQVLYTGPGTFARKYARCELADLMVLVYSPISKQARLTYLQAKSERAQMNPYTGGPFSANLEQWFLLSKRPHINGVGAFKPPSNLLFDAVLPSIGSFIFFYKDRPGKFQTYYTSADMLSLCGNYSQRYGKLCNPKAMPPPSSVYQECKIALDNYEFSKNLYTLKIGTPVIHPAPQWQLARTWLAATLKACQATGAAAGKNSSLIPELLELLSSADQVASSDQFGAKSMIIIKSEADSGA